MHKIITFFLVIVSTLMLTACGPVLVCRDGAPSQAVDVSRTHDAVPRRLPRSRYGNVNYCVMGQCYHVLASARGYKRRGIASWYGTKFDGHLTSDRETYSLYAMTAASRTLPLPTFVRVTNLRNGRHVVVKVNDRGPFVKDRLIDLSYAAAVKLGYAGIGTAPVQVEAIVPLARAKGKAKAEKKPRSSLHYAQVGTFSNRENADHMSQRLTPWVDRPIVIQKDRRDTQQIYRVRIGPIQTVAEMNQLRRLLRDHGFGDVVVVKG